MARFIGLDEYALSRSSSIGIRKFTQIPDATVVLPHFLWFLYGREHMADMPKACVNRLLRVSLIPPVLLHFCADSDKGLSG
jgi:hypothetical protein